MQETITLGGGCFWCTEAIFAQLRGVEEVQSGYSGGNTPDPTYYAVVSGKTGHAEVVEVTFDNAIISLHDILTIFFTLHDPTTLNRQQNDVGEQYRSVIFYRTAAQKEIAQQVMEEIAAQEIWPDPIVTTLEPFQAFYPAEAEHDRYYERNTNNPYCQII